VLPASHSGASGSVAVTAVVTKAYAFGNTSQTGFQSNPVRVQVTPAAVGSSTQSGATDGMVTGEAPIMSDQMGMLMKLPYFYTEDAYLADVFGRTKSLDKQEVMAQSRQDVITPLQMIFSSRKRQETYQYWFTNRQEEAIVWTVSSQNTLRSLVDSLFNKKQPLEIRAQWHYKKHLPTDRIHWNLGNVELL
jgi:hypothetical protein